MSIPRSQLRSLPLRQCIQPSGSRTLFAAREANILVAAPSTSTQQGFHSCVSSPLQWTSAQRLPRAAPGRSKKPSAPDVTPLTEDEYARLQNDAGASSSSAPRTETASEAEIPWFLEDQGAIEVDRPAPDNDKPAHGEASIAPAEDELPASLPHALAVLHTHLVTGPAAGLLNRGNGFSFDLNDTGSDVLSEEAEDRLSKPFAFIPARSILGSTSWCDWIVVVTVRENRGGQVNARMAEEVGEVLKRVGPPKLQDQAKENQLDSLLGPLDAQTSSPSSSGAQGNHSMSPFGPNPSMASSSMPANGSGAPSTEVPAWKAHRQALLSKFIDSEHGTTAWRPNKVLSRETQRGLRLLHSSDPERWSLSVLSQEFKVSPEAVRRILKARPERWGGDAKESGSGTRAGEKAGAVQSREQREEDEIQKLRQSIAMDRGQGGIGGQEETETTSLLEEEVEEEEAAAAAAAQSANKRQHTSKSGHGIDVRSLGKPRHPVRFEGLPVSGPQKRKDTRRAKSSINSDLGAGGGGNAAEDGEWVLVDAGWCVVHVMTPKARVRFDVEGVWKEIQQDASRAAEENVLGV